MNPWPFVTTAYAVTLLAALGLARASYRAMRHAEHPAARREP